MVKQLHAGYLLGPLLEILPQKFNDVHISSILKVLSTFEIETNLTYRSTKDPVIAVLNNIISRGLPTLPSLLIEEIFSETFGISKRVDNTLTGEIVYKPSESLAELSSLIVRSLFVIEPRCNQESLISYDNIFGSHYEKEFYYSVLPNLSHSFVLQLIEPQRELKNILTLNNGDWEVNRNFNKSAYSNLFKQRVDFALEYPITDNFEKGIVIEIDGPGHNEPGQKHLDEVRDKILKRIQWKSVRITTSEMDEGKLDHLDFNHPFLDILSENFNHPLWQQKSGLDALQIALTPFAIARIQKTILYLFQIGLLDFNKKELKIAIIERDVPCGFIAIEDLIKYFNNLFLLEDKGRAFPAIKLKIFSTEEFYDSKLNEGIQKAPLKSFDTSEFFDAILDISILQRNNLDYPNIQMPEYSENYVKIRSVRSIKESRRVLSAQPLQYKIPESEQPKPLVFFLRNIFRKTKFREGQVPILKRTLTLQNVVSLLPTGAGKSLTYQLSALLQPGIVLVVDPLKSLMKDQNDNLRMIGIDSTVFINSSITNPLERKILSERMTKGYYQFIFISPERLQIEEFREYLLKMDEAYFTYVVVDEAHCVSEWGHDFRTSYLQLGRNAKKFCRTLVKMKNIHGEEINQVPIIGLTGTASFEVLADVQRELDFSESDDAAIIAPSKYQRDELNFIIRLLEETNTNQGNADEWAIKEQLATDKYSSLFSILEGMPELFDQMSLEEYFSRSKEYKNCGIVFCPHVKWHFGVIKVSEALKTKYPSLDKLIDVYAGKLADDETSGIDLDEVQRRFKNDETALLVATKAFGMGIDKPNIRFTVHLNMPQSIEAFYQEAGRAGRDKEKAYCYIIYSPTKIPGQSETIDKQLMLSFHKAAFRGKEKEKRVLWELLDEITYPNDKNIDTINYEFQQELFSFEKIIEHGLQTMSPTLKIWFGSLSISYKGGDVHKRLYLNVEPFPKTVGYIDLDTEECFAENKSKKLFLDGSVAKEIMEEVYSWLKSKQPVGLSFLDWIRFQKENKNEPGIEKILAKTDSAQITIGFINRPLQILEDRLARHDLTWDLKMIEQAYKFSYTPQEFIQALKREYRKKSGNMRNPEISQNMIQYIHRNFNHFRTREDTFKAIYRLSLIGIVDEYTIDYNSRTIKAFISRKETNTYIQNLQNYIGKYVPVNERNKIPEEILNTKGNSVIQKCCGYLMEFVYKKIASRRLAAIETMERAILSKNFSEFVNTYFDSKYTPQLREKLYDYNIKDVWHFINLTEGDPNNLSHLRGACDRLIDDNPDNPTLLLLSAFSRFLIPSDNKEDALQDLRKGLMIFKEYHKWDRNYYLEVVSKFIAETVKYDLTIEKYFSLFLLEEHLNWIKKFNLRIWKGMEHVKFRND